MEFDKTRVYTAVNAAELKVGSLIIAALNPDELERKVELEVDAQTLEHISDSGNLNRFGLNIYDDVDKLRYYPLAYLVGLPKEPQYKPFSSIKKAMEVIKKHGGWVMQKGKEDIFFIDFVGYCGDLLMVKNVNNEASVDTFLDCFTFADDGSPCGELVEE